METANLEQRVVRIVADALGRDADEVRVTSSLVDDLGAESIDFIDIQYRLESELGIEIGEAELWQGTLDLSDERTFNGDRLSQQAMTTLRKRQPGFAWHRFDSGITRADLPRLITVKTILDYLAAREDA